MTHLENRKERDRDSRIYDLVVVGAGPGGSNAAGAALEGGLTVAQIDREVFPRVKPCAGGMTGKSLRALRLDPSPTLRRHFSTFEFNVWERDIHRFTHRSPIISMVVRPEFDNHLVERNRRQGGFSFFPGEAVRDVRYDPKGRIFRVATVRRTLLGRQLVGADGANGIVNRLFKVSRVPARALAVEVNLFKANTSTAATVVPCIDLCYVPWGYAWVFPKGDQWSVGIYTLSRGLSGIRSRLQNYIERKGFRVDGDPLETFEAHPIPVGGALLRSPPFPLYVVGDAGGFAEAVLGEGIFCALESGRLAGETAVAVARQRSDPQDYHRRLRRTVLLDTRLSWRMSRLIYGRPKDLAWRAARRFFQRLCVQGYASGTGLSGSLKGLLLHWPLSFRDARLETFRLDGRLLEGCLPGSDSQRPFED